MTALICPHRMKPHSDLTGVIYLRVKDTVTTDTVCNGQEGKDDKQQQHYCRDRDTVTCKAQRAVESKTGKGVRHWHYRLNSTWKKTDNRNTQIKR